MTTYPLGYLMAAWIALEDIHPDSGPLFYYPGSHKLPYVLNEDFNAGSSRWRLGSRDYDVYEDRMAALVQEAGIQPQVFLPKKGDVLLWHANLVHGGTPVADASRTRKSMVIHYFGEQVIKYHEITERPALMPE
jgi:ectoine hydroxylase-related dioxygenase (phytanoyl-CoA dioxygenase family)